MPEVQVPGRVVCVSYLCDFCEDGNMVKVAGTINTSEPQFNHQCNTCSRTVYLERSYPTFGTAENKLHYIEIKKQFIELGLAKGLYPATDLVYANGILTKATVEFLSVSSTYQPLMIIQTEVEKYSLEFDIKSDASNQKDCVLLKDVELHYQIYGNAAYLPVLQKTSIPENFPPTSSKANAQRVIAVGTHIAGSFFSITPYASTEDNSED